VSLAVRPRSPALRPFVRSLGFYSGELPPGRERVLPTGEVSLFVNLFEDEVRTYDGPDAAVVRRTRGAVLLGPRASHQVIDTEEQRDLVEIDFEVGGAACFFGMPMSAARDEIVELDEVWGREGAVLRERLLEAEPVEEQLAILEETLLALAVHPLEPDPAIGLAVEAFERGRPVAEVVSQLGWSSRRFVRRFRDRIGLAPKEFSRVRRLQRVVRSVAGDGATCWAEVAFEHGYYDQSHLVHDFRELAGITPTAYSPRSPQERNHVPLAPAA
jgi:AraC-like DNA-binding protein